MPLRPAPPGDQPAEREELPEPPGARQAGPARQAIRNQPLVPWPLVSQAIAAGFRPGRWALLIQQASAPISMPGRFAGKRRCPHPTTTGTPALSMIRAICAALRIPWRSRSVRQRHDRGTTGPLQAVGQKRIALMYGSTVKPLGQQSCSARLERARQDRGASGAPRDTSQLHKSCYFLTDQAWPSSRPSRATRTALFGTGGCTAAVVWATSRSHSRFAWASIKAPWPELSSAPRATRHGDDLAAARRQAGRIDAEAWGTCRFRSSAGWPKRRPRFHQLSHALDPLQTLFPATATASRLSHRISNSATVAAR